ANDLDDLLAWRQALQHRLVHRLVANSIDECLDDFEVDVRFEQGEPDFAQRGFYMVRRQPNLAAQRFEDILNARAERLEHVSPATATAFEKPGLPPDGRVKPSGRKRLS